VEPRRRESTATSNADKTLPNNLVGLLAINASSFAHSQSVELARRTSESGSFRVVVGRRATRRMPPTSPVNGRTSVRNADHPLGVRRSFRWIARLSAKCSRIDVSKGSFAQHGQAVSCDTEVCFSSNALCECVMNLVVAVGRRRFGRSRVARRVGAGVQTS
jgi:hypothetical protein